MQLALMNAFTNAYDWCRHNTGLCYLILLTLILCGLICLAWYWLVREDRRQYAVWDGIQAGEYERAKIDKL